MTANEKIILRLIIISLLLITAFFQFLLIGLAEPCIC